MDEFVVKHIEQEQIVGKARASNVGPTRAESSGTRKLVGERSIVFVFEVLDHCWFLLSLVTFLYYLALFILDHIVADELIIFHADHSETFLDESLASLGLLHLHIEVENLDDVWLNVTGDFENFLGAVGVADLQ